MAISNQFWSTFIRVAALGGKSVLMLILAKELDVEAYGAFGLIVVTISFTVYILGFEFYTHSVRSIVGTNNKDKERRIRDQFVFLLLGYLFWLPVIYGFVLLDIIPLKLVLQFYLLLVLEHISTELYRLLVALKKPVSASMCFFFRNASWGYVLIVFVLAGTNSLDVETVLLYWILGSAFSIIYGISRLGLDWSRLFGKEVDWGWIKTGSVVGAGFLAGTLLLRATGIADRYLIHLYLGDYAVGIYTLYISITGIVSTFFESGLLMHAFPGILEAHKDGELVLYRKRMREFLIQSLVVSLVLIIGAYILFHALLMFGLIKSEYGEESTCFIVMLLGVLVKNMSFTPHYGLYVNGQDSKILLSSVVGFFLAASLCVILIPKMGILGAAVSIFIANLGILVAKTKSYMDYSKAY